MLFTNANHVRIFIRFRWAIGCFFIFLCRLLGGIFLLCLAKILSGREINTLRDFLTTLTCYNSRPCLAGSVFGSECSFASFVHAGTYSWKIWHSGNNSPC